MYKVETHYLFLITSLDIMPKKYNVLFKNYTMVNLVI